MAIPFMETGYKPEFSLGAVYQGANAANADNSAQEELIRQFLANQRELSMQPMDREIKAFEAAKAQAQNTPELLQRFVQSQQAGMDKTIGEEELRAARQPFEMQKIPLFAKKEQTGLVNDANLLELQKTIANGVDRNGLPIAPADMKILNQELQRQVAMRGQTPELYGKLEHEKLQGQNALARQQLANEGQLAATQARSAGTGGGDKLKQAWIKLAPEVRMGQIQGALATNTNPLTGEQLTDTERMFFEEQFEQDRRIVNAKVNSKTQGNVTLQDGKIVPVAPVDVAPRSTPQSTAGTTKSGNKFVIEKTGD